MFKSPRFLKKLQTIINNDALITINTNEMNIPKLCNIWRYVTSKATTSDPGYSGAFIPLPYGLTEIAEMIWLNCSSRRPEFVTLLSIPNNFSINISNAIDIWSENNTLTSENTKNIAINVLTIFRFTVLLTKK